MLLLEAVVELLGDFLDVKGSPHPARDINDSQAIFFVQHEDELLQFLDQCFARLVPLRVDMVTKSVRLARLAFHPLPVEGISVVGGVDDDVFADDLGNGFFDFLTGGVVRAGVVGVRCVLVDNQTAFLGDGFENERATCDCGFSICSAVIPAKFFNEQGVEVTVLQVAPDCFSVEGLRHVEERTREDARRVTQPSCGPASGFAGRPGSSRWR